MIVDDHRLVVHPVIEPMEFVDVENLAGNKPTGPILERTEPLRAFARALPRLASVYVHRADELVLRGHRHR